MVQCDQWSLCSALACKEVRLTCTGEISLHGRTSGLGPAAGTCAHGRPRISSFTQQMRGNLSARVRQSGGMTDLQKFQRVCRVYLARLLMVYGPAAPDLLRRMADELDWLERQRLDAEM